jgi:hypothetical protein
MDTILYLRRMSVSAVLPLGSGDEGTVYIDEWPVAVVPTAAEERAAEKYQSLNRTWRLNAKLHVTFIQSIFMSLQQEHDAWLLVGRYD